MNYELSPNWRTLYICSAARCGSTITDMFIGGHSQAASLGEVNLLGKAISLQQTCSCGANVPDCAYWNLVYQELATSMGVDIKADPYTYSLWDALAVTVVDKRKQTSSYKMAVYLRKVWLEMRYRTGNKLPLLNSQIKALKNKLFLYDAVAQKWCKKVIVDSSKNAREAVELNKMAPGKVKIVLISRDGRGVYHSRRKSHFTQRKSLKGWMNYYKRAQPLLEKEVDPADLLIIRYEDLAAKPREVGNKLCEFISLGFEESMLNLGAATRHIVNGNDTRLSADKGIQLDEKWRSELMDDELEYFIRSGGEELNQRLGYM
ncbi:sulfotransferase [Amphritea pacifica]|uniref:sulfotransferase n=1 Tax=Amphritea pacifica TaxID=2811233 RepID=UPI00196578DA|nr:sulfotransferase [Amphritea pacifica]MBN1008730.1 sulfotransferase [Amphritea pacifica]